MKSYSFPVPKLLSVVIPCYGSEASLEGVVKEVKQVCGALPGYDYEIILVNDCSPDHVGEVIRRLALEDERIIGIFHTKNFGQHAAILSGFREAKGDILLCLDDDGQTPPQGIPKLLAALEGGADAVYARYGKKQHSLFRNFGSRVNDLMLRLMLKKPKELQVTSFFAVRRYIAESMLSYDGAYPYLIGLVLRSTGSIVNVEVEHRARTQGRSGYSLKKLLALWMNGFTAFSILPLRAATFFGTLFAVAGFIYGLFTIIKKLLLPGVPVGFSSLMAAVVFIGGMLMLMLGIIGEYVGRMYLGMNRTPQAVVREVVRRG